MPPSFDLAVLGAGPAGYVAAIRAAQLGLETAVVERDKFGGVCVYEGCIPTKALLKSAEVVHLVQSRAKEFGLRFENLSVDYGVAFKRSRRTAKRLSKGIQHLFKTNDVAVFEGTGTLLAPDRVRVTLNEGEQVTLETQHLLVATGARPRSIPGLEIDGEKVISYKQAVLSDRLPQSAIIVGAGAIGVEIATIWNSYGVDVTLVEMLDHLVPLEDEEVSQELAKRFNRLQIKSLTGTRVEGGEVGDSGVRLTVSREGETQTLEAEVALIAIGFQPNSDGIGLEEIGVELSERGRFVEVDEHMRTNLPNVYAAGDVTGKLMLAHVGSAQGVVAAESIAGVETVVLDYDMMPRATYCQPQIASFGLTEKQARERGHQVAVGRFPFLANGKALGLGDWSGFVKIIADQETEQIIGAHLIGPEVTELLPELVLAHNAGLSPEEIGRAVHAHPTLSEAVMEAAHNVLGQAIHG